MLICYHWFCSLYLDKSVSTVGSLLGAEGFGYPLSVGQKGTVGQSCCQRGLLDLQTHTRTSSTLFNDEQQRPCLHLLFRF